MKGKGTEISAVLAKWLEVHVPLSTGVPLLSVREERLSPREMVGSARVGPVRVSLLGTQGSP